MTPDDLLKQEEYLFDDGGGEMSKCDTISLFGDGYDVPDSGSVFCSNGIISLSWGLCEEIKRKAPGIQGFNVQVILTPKQKDGV